MDRYTSPVPSDAPTPFDPLGFAPGAEAALDPLAPQGPTPTHGTGTGTGTDGGAAPEADDAAPARRTTARARPRLVTNVNDISRVPDRVGERVREGFADFLQTYTDASESGDAMGPPLYVEQIRALHEFDKTTLFVEFAHLMEYDEVLASAIKEQYYRFLPFLRAALRDLVGTYTPEYLYLNAHAATKASAGLVLRDFSLAFFHLGLSQGIRDLRTEQVGKLVTISGTVTRTSEVRPELLYGAFTCDECKDTQRDVEQQFKYTQPIMCYNPLCHNRQNWELNVEQSRFSDWQKVRIQENANEIPTGSMPRSLDVILRGEMVERAKAGDKCTFTGTFVVLPDVSQLGIPGVNAQIQREVSGGGRATDGIPGVGVTGLKSLGVRDLTYRTAFVACMVQSTGDRGAANVRAGDGEVESTEDFLASLTEAERDELEAMVSSDHIYSRLVQSIAPTVYGHEIIKKGLLLQLMSGVHKVTPEGIHLRGDINICIVGDPSTSKSQFLKYVCSFLPRAVYTSGKASSAAGLTAAVVKDEETGEHTIEAGALMLADNGICAIDEFDKMDVSDQVAIHEAMEQQTISIAKAGMQATLNARASILAAANPVGGRYNRKQTLRANVAMSAPIMSRFDLFFVVLDECDAQTDLHIAEHIVNVHRFRERALDPEFSAETLQRYIRFARTFQPKLTPEASDVLVDKYRMLRQDDAGSGGRSSYRITVRQLESMIRLAEAIARANCTPDILPQFVNEAYSLLRKSIIHVEKDDVDFDEDEEEFGALPTSSAQLQPTSDAEQLTPAPAAASTDPPGEAQQAGTPAPATTATPAGKVKISYEQYQEMAEVTLMRVLEEERRIRARQAGENDDDGDQPEEEQAGIDREALVVHWLEHKEEDIATEAQLEHETLLINKVINKLLKDRKLIQLDADDTQDTAESSVVQDTAAQQSSGGEAQQRTGKKMIMLHPSVDFDALDDVV